MPKQTKEKRMPRDTGNSNGFVRPIEPYGDRHRLMGNLGDIVVTLRSNKVTGPLALHTARLYSNPLSQKRFGWLINQLKREHINVVEFDLSGTDFEPSWHLDAWEPEAWSELIRFINSQQRLAELTLVMPPQPISEGVLNTLKACLTHEGRTPLHLCFKSASPPCSPLLKQLCELPLKVLTLNTAPLTVAQFDILAEAQALEVNIGAVDATLEDVKGTRLTSPNVKIMRITCLMDEVNLRFKVRHGERHKPKQQILVRHKKQLTLSDYFWQEENAPNESNHVFMALATPRPMIFSSGSAPQRTSEPELTEELITVALNSEDTEEPDWYVSCGL